MLSCVFTHVFDFVQLVDDFFTDEGLKDVLQGHRSFGATKFVGDQRKMLFGFEEEIERFFDALLHSNSSDGLHQILHRGAVLVVGRRTEDARAQDQSKNIIGEEIKAGIVSLLADAEGTLALADDIDDPEAGRRRCLSPASTSSQSP